MMRLLTQYKIKKIQKKSTSYTTKRHQKNIIFDIEINIYNI